MTASEPVKIGAIGAGYWGPNLIRNFVELSSARMLGVADLNPARLAHIASRFPQLDCVTEDYRQLFDAGVEAVVISTPPETHAEIALECFEAGVDVLVEKPLATSSTDARTMVDAAADQGRVLMTGHTFEHNPAVHALKGMIDRGDLGSIHYLDAVRVGLGLFHPTLNVIWDLGPHDVSILINILGEQPTSISAQGSACVQEGVVDIAYLTLTFPSGITAHVRLSWLDPSKTRRITVVGSEKMSIYDDLEPNEKIRLYDKGVDTIRRTDTYGDFSFAYRYGDIISPFIHFEEPLKLECQHFLDRVRDRQLPSTDGMCGLRVVQVIEAAQLSLANNGAIVQIAYDVDPNVVNLTGTAPAAVAGPRKLEAS
jgi:predicted dehydrogenase